MELADLEIISEVIIIVDGREQYGKEGMVEGREELPVF